jgi:hypothetical protein
MATGISNSETLTVTKRGSAESQHIPVVTVEVGGTRYLVSTRGESQWVKNVRANSTVTLTNKSGAVTYVAHETPTSQRQPILAAYQKKAGKAVDGYFRKLPDPADHPVFALTATT